MTEVLNNRRIRDDRDTGRFVIDHEGLAAELRYEARLVLARTSMPMALEGQGLGGRLIRAALVRARSDQLTLVPMCSFANRWLKGHLDATEGVTIDWPLPGDGPFRP